MDSEPAAPPSPDVAAEEELAPPSAVRRYRRLAAVVLVSALVAGFIAYSILSQLGRLHHVHVQLRPEWLVASAVLCVVFQFAQAELWRQLLRALGAELPRPAAWSIWCTSLLARYVPTQVLLLVLRVGGARRLGATRRQAAAAVAYEFGFAVSGAATLSIVGLLELPALRHTQLRWLLLLVPVALIAALQPGLFGRLFAVVGRRLGTEGPAPLLHAPQIAVFALLYAATFAAANLALVAFAAGVTHLTHQSLALYSAYGVGYCAAVALFFIPGGLGARDGATVSILAITLPLTTALLVAVGVRILQTLVEVLSAGVMRIVVRRSRETRFPGTLDST